MRAAPTLIATGEAGRDRPDRENVEVEAQHGRPRRHHRRYGADVARWFMLSDSPPERDVEWTERGVQGAWRFVQRLWRLVGEAAEIAEAAPAARPAHFRRRPLALRKAAHQALGQGHR